VTVAPIQEVGVVEQTLDLLCPGAPVEIRVLTDKMLVRRFENHTEAAAWALSFPDARGIYVVMNPFDASAIERSAVNDTSVTRRRWLLIDVDAERLPDTNAANAELALALALVEQIKAYLQTCGWTDPVEAVSGNGAHLLYPIDLPNDAEARALVEGVLTYLASTIKMTGVHVDTSVGNASRITKLYGTMVQKGPATPDRPHRLSAITCIPDVLVPVPLFDFQKVAKLGMGNTPPVTPTATITEKRNKALTSEAGKLRNLRLNEDEIYAALVAINRNRCKPELPEAEVKKIAKSVAGYDPGAAPTSGPNLIIRRACDVPDEKLVKAFGGRLVQGSIALVSGPGDSGKGMSSVYLLARFTTGEPFPGETTGRPRMTVLLCVTEDSEGRVKSRLRAAGADLTRVCFASGPDVTRGGLTMPSPMMLDDDAGPLVRYAKQLDAKVLFLETTVEHFGGRDQTKVRRSTNNEADVRSALAPFRAVCQEGGLYGLGAIHPRKSTEGSINDSISGSAAFRNVTRSAHHVYCDPEDESDNPVRLLFTSKANYLARKPSTLRFRIVSWDEQQGMPCDCHVVNCGHEGRVVWDEEPEDDRTAEQIWKQLAERNKPRNDVAVEEAEEFLNRVLEGGLLPPKEIEKRAKAELISMAAVRRAKEKLKVVSVKEGFPAEVVGWRLPGM